MMQNVLPVILVLLCKLPAEMALQTKLVFQDYEETTSPELKTDTEVVAGVGWALSQNYMSTWHVAPPQDFEYFPVTDERIAKNLRPELGGKFHVLSSQNNMDIGYVLGETCGKTADDPSKLWLIFRGSESYLDFGYDAYAGATNHGLSGKLGCVGVHSGVFNKLAANVDYLLKDMGDNELWWCPGTQAPHIDLVKIPSQCTRKEGAAPYDKMILGGHSLGGGMATMATTFLWLRDDIPAGEEEFGKALGLDVEYWNARSDFWGEVEYWFPSIKSNEDWLAHLRGGSADSYAQVYGVLNVLAKKALGLKKLDASAYPKIQLIGLEAAPTLERLSSFSTENTGCGDIAEVKPFLHDEDNLIKRRLSNAAKIITGDDWVPRMQGFRDFESPVSLIGLGQVISEPFNKHILFTNNYDIVKDFNNKWYPDEDYSKLSRVVVEVPVAMMSKAEQILGNYLLVDGSNADMWLAERLKDFDPDGAWDRHCWIQNFRNWQDWQWGEKKIHSSLVKHQFLSH